MRACALNVCTGAHVHSRELFEAGVSRLTTKTAWLSYKQIKTIRSPSSLTWGRRDRGRCTASPHLVYTSLTGAGYTVMPAVHTTLILIRILSFDRQSLKSIIEGGGQCHFPIIVVTLNLFSSLSSVNPFTMCDGRKTLAITPLTDL